MVAYKEPHRLSPPDVIRLESISCDLPMAANYKRVQFSAAPEEQC